MMPTDRAPHPWPANRFHGGGRQDLQDAFGVLRPLFRHPRLPPMENGGAKFPQDAHRSAQNRI